MSTATMTREDTWFAGLENTIIGETFVGDRTHLHVAELVALAPDVLSLHVLCGAGDRGDVDVSTLVRNVHLKGASEKECRQWWQKKASVEPNQTLDRMLPGGLRRPRLCRRCKGIRDVVSAA